MPVKRVVPIVEVTQMERAIAFAGDGVTGTATCCYVDDVDVLFRTFLAAGLKTPGNPESPVEEGPVDPDGNALRFGSPIMEPQ